MSYCNTDKDTSTSSTINSITSSPSLSSLSSTSSVVVGPISNHHGKDEKFEEYQQTLNEICQGMYKARCLNMVTELNIAAMLTDGQKYSCDELAEQVGVDAKSLFKVMRALSTMGIFNHHTDGLESVDSHLFSQSPISKMLLDTDTRNLLLYECGDFSYKSWLNIGDTVKTGVSSIPKSFGADSFIGALHKNQKDLNIFEKGMTGMTRPGIPKLLQQSDFSKFDIVADIGGCQGVLIQEILKYNKNIKKGINFDLPITIENNRLHLDRVNVDPRFIEIEGSFFEQVPQADCYILSKIMMDDEPSKKILEIIRQSIKPNGKVYIYDCILEKESQNYSYKCWVDVHLWHSLNSSGRTIREWRELAKSAGFKVDQFIGESLIVMSKLISD
ncbi:O-methyltransferase family 2 protein [Cavenderia fasciculata]|uniref:O-methyltransferase family 2 protein n=1 Tax=Cavenderia fasciculata TaxID=261658 RepID=F4PMT1_CACFS|nr:O-methyltransferase family 2 protein [Cavenderia fasciculata]EGG23675.1 O-methyltransferase family 2 protein [Cavenderia fasciculata]|eukprot:XP_004361526.1 O-methyltransferase family 2 protein [Cavenderia fasciculata]